MAKGACGAAHTVLIRSDGNAVAYGNLDQHRRNPDGRYDNGNDRYGICDVPALPPDGSLRYVAAAAGDCHTVLIRSDGEAIAFGRNDAGQCIVPRLPRRSFVLQNQNSVAAEDSRRYRFVLAAAGGAHTVLLCDDGTAVAFGDNSYGNCDVPELPAGLYYVGAAAGGCHTVLLRSDGVCLAFGANSAGQCSVPTPRPGTTYVAVAAGGFHTVLLCSDGMAVAFGSRNCGQCSVPALPQGVRYTAVAAGRSHTCLLRSDGGITMTCDNGTADLPDLPLDVHYVDCFAGNSHSFLLRSDGEVLAISSSTEAQLFQQLLVPPLEAGITYEVPSRASMILTLNVEDACESVVPGHPSHSVTCTLMSGVENAKFSEDGSTILFGDIRREVARRVGQPVWNITLVSQGGEAISTCFDKLTLDTAMNTLGNAIENKVGMAFLSDCLGRGMLGRDLTLSREEMERRHDPLLGGRAVTYDQMVAENAAEARPAGRSYWATLSSRTPCA